MNEYSIFICSSFPKTPTGGNKAGVWVGETQLASEVMQRIATQIGLSETAFVTLQADGSVFVRFFTPTQEVPLCGHATVAAFSVLLQENGWKPGIYVMHGILGTRNVEITEEGTICLTQENLVVGEVLTNTDLLSLTDIEEDDLWEEFPARVISVGLPIAVLGIRSCGTLVSMEVDKNAIENYLERHKADILYIVSRQVVQPKSAVQGRMFAPKLGIMDEPATGMAAGAAGAYLYQCGITKENTVAIEQGYSTGQPSEIIVKIVGESNSVLHVQIEGTAILREKRLVYV